MGKPAWRNFEELVSRIEHALTREGATVKSPDHVPCVTTGTSREVDVSIRTTVGSAQVLITVECRKRGAVQDVTWIEQLATKRKNIGAARTIAVAVNGFSGEAVRIARENAIDLRVLDEITRDDIQAWVRLVGVTHVFKDCELAGAPEVKYHAEPGDQVGQPVGCGLSGGSVGVAPVFCVDSGEKLSLNDIWLRAEDQTGLFEKVPKDGKPYPVAITVSPTDNLQVCTSIGNRRVESVRLPLLLRWKHEFVPLVDAKVVRYAAVDGMDPLQELVRVEFETKQAGTNNIRLGFQFQCNQPGASVSLQLLPSEG